MRDKQPSIVTIYAVGTVVLVLCIIYYVWLFKSSIFPVCVPVKDALLLTSPVAVWALSVGITVNRYYKCI